jgi:hypothetical protein
MEVATDGVRKGEVGCLFDEIQNLVEPTERLHTDVQAGPQRGRMPERRGRSHAGPRTASDSPSSGEGRTPEWPDHRRIPAGYAFSLRVIGEVIGQVIRGGE